MPLNNAWRNFWAELGCASRSLRRPEAMLNEAYLVVIRSDCSAPIVEEVGRVMRRYRQIRPITARDYHA